MTTIHGPSGHRTEPDDEPATRTESSNALGSSLLLLAGAILLPISGLFHPAPNADEDWEIGNAVMLADDAFVRARVLEMGSLVLLLAAFAMIARSPNVRRLVWMRAAVITLVVAIALAVADQVLFILAADEANDLLAGASTPFFDAHLVVQAVITPLLGAGIAVLAVIDARRSARWTWLPAAPAVAGGLLAAGFGPLLALTRDLSVLVVGAGWSLVGLWLLVTAIRRLVNVRRGLDVALT